MLLCVMQFWGKHEFYLDVTLSGDWYHPISFSSQINKRSIMIKKTWYSIMIALLNMCLLYHFFYHIEWLDPWRYSWCKWSFHIFDIHVHFTKHLANSYIYILSVVDGVVIFNNIHWKCWFGFIKKWTLNGRGGRNRSRSTHTHTLRHKHTSACTHTHMLQLHKETHAQPEIYKYPYNTAKQTFQTKYI